MSAMMSLSPTIIERTSNDPHVRAVHGAPTINIPRPESIRDAMTVGCASCCGRDKQAERPKDLPFQAAKMPQPTSPRMQSTQP